MNELAIVFDKMKIDTKEVVEGMNTKWNALGFTPGLVGGHCIGVDPYYFIYQAEKLGYHSQIILSGRKINDGMGEFVANVVIREMIRAKVNVSTAKILILGATFKENCPDIRNSKVFDIYNALLSYGIKPDVFDDNANAEEIEKEYGVRAVADEEELANYDCVIVAVAHNSFARINFEKLFKQSSPNKQKIVFDVKGFLDRNSFTQKGFSFWRL
jgi:UDP-N-acetyl-D-galactosamine dehydrogenase